MATTTELDTEPPELVAEAGAALSRALTGPVTDADLDVLDSAMWQVQVRVDVQRGVTGRVTSDVSDDHPGQTSGRPGSRGGAVRTVHADLPGSWVCLWRR